MQKLKILYYNWVDFEEEERGGGVSIYQRNLVDAATRQGDDVWFLSSGVSYSPFSHRPFLREVKARTEGVRKFEIVNATLFSPGQEAFGVDVADSPAMDEAFREFPTRKRPIRCDPFQQPGRNPRLVSPPGPRALSADESDL